MRIKWFFFEQNWIPFTEGCFVPSLVEIDPVLMRRRFFNFVNVFLLFHNYLPLEEGGALHLNKFESPFIQGCVVPSVDWNWPSGSGEEDKNVKILQQRQRWKTNKFRSHNLTLDFGAKKVNLMLPVEILWFM